MATQQTIRDLYQRYLSNQITASELDEFLAAFNMPEHEALLASLMNGTWEEMFAEPEAEAAPVRRMFPWRRTVSAYRRIAAAIVVVLLLSVGYVILMKDKKPVDIAQNPPALKNEVLAPTSNKARITLADGSTVSLDSVNNGTLALQGNMKVVKNEKGEIVYEQSSAVNGQLPTVAYNTLYNPRGSKAISLTLSDGSQVWLNAESSLKYPTSFSGNERKVEITGEAYFEVAHNAAMPFKVKLPTSGGKEGGEVAVLGTHFNVNAYDDENTLKVTLLEGSVKVSTEKQSAIIKPGQQAVISSPLGGGQVGAGQLSTFNNPDLEAVMAWKNGLFSFKSSNIKTVMRQLARWYDIDVAYEGDIPADKFGGEMGRDLNLSQVLKALEKSKVHFRIEGKKVTVIK